MKCIGTPQHDMHIPSRLIKDLRLVAQFLKAILGEYYDYAF